MKIHIAKLKVGDVVTLNDEVTLKDSVIAKTGAKGWTGKVIAKRTITEQNQLFKFEVAQLTDGKEEKYIFQKIVDSLSGLRIYRFNGWLNPGTKDDLINNGCEVLFFGDGFTNKIDLKVGEIDAHWTKKNATVFGETNETPARSGLKYPLFTSITEYKSSDDIDCKEIIILETNDLIEFMEGWNIDETDLDILAV